MIKGQCVIECSAMPLRRSQTRVLSLEEARNRKICEKLSESATSWGQERFAHSGQRKAYGDHEKGEVAGDGSDGVQKPDAIELHRPCD